MRYLKKNKKKKHKKINLKKNFQEYYQTELG